MLKSATLVAFVATADAGRAMAFYRDVLGLTLTADTPFALIFDAHGVTLRVQKVRKVVVSGYTALGWDVADIAATVATLQGRGVVFERFEGLEQDRHAIWRTPDGSQVAWFRDPDGNLLSIGQHAKR
ncbi:MAG TPA: VOC family protein [Burkholderiaceae bacterium]|nr:VOC family protein [Burkholderiaceae bacterium]